jgi:hypothetical protein
MKTPGTFALYIRPGDPHTPARAKVMVQSCFTDSDGRVFITPECVALGEIEGYINGLQDDLDQLREIAKRTFREQR